MGAPIQAISGNSELLIGDVKKRSGLEPQGTDTFNIADDCKKRVFVELQQGDKGPPSGVLMLAPEGMDEGEEPMKTPRGGWTLSASPIEYDLQGWRLGKRYQAFASRNASRASLVMVHNADKSEDMDYEVRIKCANEFLPCPQPDMETECMGRGECKEERCACDESFAGIGCEVEGLEPLQLEESRAIDGHRAGEWRHFSVDIGNGKKSSSAVVTLVREAGDPVLFAKRAEEGFDPLGPPAVEDFTGHAGRDGFLARQLQHNVTVRAEQSATSGKAYVSVYNVARHLGNVDASYRLKVEAGRSCPFKCNGHGTCVSGQCQCDEGYAGPLCQGRVQQLRLDGTPQSLEGSDAVSPGEWRFLKVDLTGFRFDSGAPRKMLILDVERRGPSGSLILLMGLDQFPSLATFSSRSDAYMLADNEGFKGTREYRVDGGYLRNNSKVVIGVYNDPYAAGKTSECGDLSLRVTAMIARVGSVYGSDSYLSVLVGVFAALTACTALAGCRSFAQRFLPARFRPQQQPSGLQPQRQGVDERVLASIPVRSYEEGMLRPEEATCAVCLEDYGKGDTLRELPRCGHLFHKGCLDEWLRDNSTCPLCRMEVEEPASEGGRERGNRAQSRSVGGEADIEAGLFAWLGRSRSRSRRGREATRATPAQVELAPLHRSPSQNGNEHDGYGDGRDESTRRAQEDSSDTADTGRRGPGQ